MWGVRERVSIAPAQTLFTSSRAQFAEYLTTTQTVHIDDANILCLKVVSAEVDVDALIRILRLFQDRNVNPRKVSAQRILLRSQGREVLHLEVEFAISDLTIDTLRFIAANIAQMPTTLSSVFAEAAERPSATSQ